MKDRELSAASGQWSPDVGRFASPDLECTPLPAPQFQMPPASPRFRSTVDYRGNASFYLEYRLMTLQMFGPCDIVSLLVPVLKGNGREEASRPYR